MKRLVPWHPTPIYRYPGTLVPWYPTPIYRYPGTLVPWHPTPIYRYPSRFDFYLVSIFIWCVFLFGVYFYLVCIFIWCRFLFGVDFYLGSIFICNQTSTCVLFAGSSDLKKCFNTHSLCLWSLLLFKSRKRSVKASLSANRWPVL